MSIRNAWLPRHCKESVMNDAPILRVKEYSKQFTLHEQGTLIPSSHGVNLEVYRGSLTALIGPTGAGKSTVLKGIYRTYLASAGRLTYTTAGGAEVDLARADEHHLPTSAAHARCARWSRTRCAWRQMRGRPARARA